MSQWNRLAFLLSLESASVFATLVLAVFDDDDEEEEEEEEDAVVGVCVCVVE